MSSVRKAVVVCDGRMQHRTHRRGFIVLTAALLSVAGIAFPASAAPPTNDSIDSATQLGTPPAKIVEDTSQATANPADGRCVAGSSVWFRTRPTVSRTMRVTTLGSDYAAVLAVFRGPKAHRTRIGCAAFSFDSTDAAALQVHLTAGTTYWVAVSACCRRGAPGGQLVLNTSLPAAAGISVNIDTVETGTISGQLVVAGTVHCNTPSEYELDLTASERVNAGANVARGSGYKVGVCGAVTTPWKTTIDSDTGWAFQAGNARLTRTAYVHDGFQFRQIGPSTSNFVVTENPNLRSASTTR
jgi:hypothetical protein